MSSSTTSSSNGSADVLSPSLPLLTSSSLTVNVHTPATLSASHIDMRSDTVTQPPPEMRKIMAEAAVGDDVFGDDPTVLQLQDYAAKLLDKEAALWVPSGTMSNLIAALTHCPRRGSEVILGDLSHMHLYEQGGIASLGGVHPRSIPNESDGTIALSAIEAKIRSLTDDHQPHTKLVCLEQTHNRCGGTILPVSYIDAVGDICKKHGLALHIDGARLFHACVALNVSAARMVAAADSISICLSKGLAAPMGSLLVGRKAFIVEAKRLRKALGGGTRQVGIVAAAGLFSLQRMINRLSDDHALAQHLAQRIAGFPGVRLNLSTVQSNLVFVFFDLSKFASQNPNAGEAAIAVDAPMIAAELKSVHSVWAVAMAKDLIRFVIHYQITAEMVDKVIVALKTVLEKFVKKE